MFLQKHDLPTILITEVDVHGVVDDLSVRETQPVQVVQKVTHTFPKPFVVLVTCTIMNHLLEHKFPTLPLRFSDYGIQYTLILFIVYSIVYTLPRTLCKLTFLIQQIVSLIFHLVQIAELEPTHEVFLHILLDWINLPDMQHTDVSRVDTIPDPSQPWFSFIPVQHIVHFLHDIIQQWFEFLKLRLLLLRVTQSLTLLLHVVDVTTDGEAECDDAEHAA